MPQPSSGTGPPGTSKDPLIWQISTIGNQEVGVDWGVVVKVADAGGNFRTWTGANLAVTLSVETGAGTLSTTAGQIMLGSTQVTITTNYDTIESGVRRI